MILNDSMYKIEEIYNKLNCNSSVETQSEGKNLQETSPIYHY